jgi:hypothetical protein
MPEPSTSPSTPCQRSRNARLTGQKKRLQNNLQLRAIQVLFAAPHGFKMAIARELTAALKAQNVRASVRSLQFWMRRFRCLGRAGRRTRSDAGFSRTWLADRQFGNSAMPVEKEIDARVL